MSRDEPPSVAYSLNRIADALERDPKIFVHGERSYTRLISMKNEEWYVQPYHQDGTLCAAGMTEDGECGDGHGPITYKRVPAPVERGVAP